MPKKLHAIQKAVKRSGKSEKSSWAIAQSAYKKLTVRKKGRKK